MRTLGARTDGAVCTASIAHRRPSGTGLSKPMYDSSPDVVTDLPMYIELHASSAFSFLDGASLPEALVDRAAALGYPALALLDRDGVYGAPRFHLAAKRAGIKAIIGAELTIVRPDSARARDRSGRESPRRRAATARPRRSREHAAVHAARPHRIARRLPQPVPARHDDEAAGGERGRGADVRGSRRAHRRPGRARRPHRDRRPRGSASAASSIASSASFGASQVYVELQRHLLREQEWDNQVLQRARRRVSRAGDCHQRRALRRAVRSAALRRPHLHPPQDHARRMRDGG